MIEKTALSGCLLKITSKDRQRAAKLNEEHMLVQYMFRARYQTILVIRGFPSSEICNIRIAFVLELAAFGSQKIMDPLVPGGALNEWI